MPGEEKEPQIGEPGYDPAKKAGVYRGTRIGPGTVQPEVSMEVGMDEMVKANMKRTYDAYQNLELEVTRDLNSLRNRMFTNALTVDHMANLRALGHSELAVDQQWNPVQQGAGDVLTARAVTIDDASLKAIGAIVATALADAISKIAEAKA